MTQIELVPIDQSGSPARPLGRLPEMVRANCDGTASFYEVIGFEPPWIGYLSVLDGHIAGGGGFKGPPRDNQVEIASYTMPAFRGRGIATATACELVRLAQVRAPGVLVIARTLPVPNASNTLLRRLGFVFKGTVVHPEDGEVWDWHLDAQPPLPVRCS